ncbi:Armadillo repeat-containing protein 3 [Microtus ochrogaster]|uniref:Armadillo repeat-containing protein 3 n=1 Tax=Microtus ochrogaster TaxID=79684 RepID=A0A8J6KLA6_MICOH|nr:Armadillo repeat-containing protein 3 [Microtus ochrogaster]
MSSSGLFGHYTLQNMFDPLTIESKKAATVVLMLNSPEEEILAKACEAIYKFALKGEENKATLLELGAVEPLTKLLTHEDKVVRRNAMMIFGILASNSDVKKLLRELEVMNSVIAQLAPEVEYTGKVQIFEHGGLEPLIRLLSSPDPDVKKNSIECIYNLVQDFQCRTTLQELNAIPPILELLKSEYPIIQLLALKTLGVITCDKESRTMLKDNQGLDQLTKILEAKELNDLHVEALSVIANCLEDMDTMVLMQQTGGLKKLLSFAENSTIPDIQKNAAKAITKAAYDRIALGKTETPISIKLIMVGSYNKVERDWKGVLPNTEDQKEVAVVIYVRKNGYLGGSGGGAER